jgi:hypothetical protein
MSQAKEEAIVDAPTPPRTPITAAATFGRSLAVSFSHLRVGEGVTQLIGREGLQQIILNAAGKQVAIEPHVVDLAGGDHDRAGLADFGQRVDVGQRITAFAKIDEQDRRACRDRERLHRVAKPALVHLLRRPAMLDGDRPKEIGGRILADERGEGIAKATRAAGIEWRVHGQLPLVVAAGSACWPVGTRER